MASLSLLLLSLLSTTLLKIHADITDSSSNMTHLQFYMHDTVTGTNPTAIQVIKGPSKYNGPGQLGFGSVLMIDDPLTKSPNLSSNLMGRAQGFYAFAGLSGNELLLSMNILFMGGEYNGSSISVFGRDSFLDKERELPVIGGSEKFRMARGYILIKTFSYVPNTNNAVLEVHVYVSKSNLSSIDTSVSSSDGVVSDDDPKGAAAGLLYPYFVPILMLLLFFVL
ncbi:hypothetical protein LUZ60_005412 [Juncus effusus]|nr:hypothetical protein LUZ60_005412 [Juncus effusus]